MIYIKNKKISSPLLLSPSLSSYTFTDLAQIVCRIPETYPDHRYSSSDDEYFDGYISEPSTLHMKPKHMYRMKRTGGSLSLSENEIDSDDLEIPVPFSLSEKTRERLNSASRSNKTKEGAETTTEQEEQQLLNAVGSSCSQSSSPSRSVKQAAATAQGEATKSCDSPATSTEDYVEIVKD